MYAAWCVQAEAAAAEQARRCSEEELQQLRDATAAEQAASTINLAEAADVIQQLQQEVRPQCGATCLPGCTTCGNQWTVLARCKPHMLHHIL
jgi:hypothetical protein